MPTLPATTIPSVRIPGIDVSFGSGSPDEWRRVLASMSVRSAPAPAVDTAVILLSGVSGQPPEVAVGDSGQISLGYDDDGPELVFTGTVESTSRDLEGRLRVVASNGGTTLARRRINQSYEQQSAGDIVSDLAGSAGVATGTIESGTSFDSYAVDDGRSVLEHVAEIARKSDLIACFDAEGGLCLKALEESGSVQELRYGVDILALSMRDASPVVEAVTAVGEGAAGSQGSGAASWLVKDPQSVTGSAGDGEIERILPDGSLRSAEAADTGAAGAANAARRRTLTGTAKVAGAPLITVGSTIEISDVPDASANGASIVTAVLHKIDHAEGFVTLVEFSKAGSGGLP